MKRKAPSKNAQLRARVQECAEKVKAMADALQRDYQPEIVLAAFNRYVATRREENRIARERAALRRQQAELRERAARLTR